MGTWNCSLAFASERRLVGPPDCCADMRSERPPLVSRARTCESALRVTFLSAAGSDLLSQGSRLLCSRGCAIP